MLKALGKRGISKDADFYIDAGNESTEEVRVPEILPPDGMLKVSDGRGSTVIRRVNDSRMRSRRYAGVLSDFAEVDFGEYLPIFDEITRAMPNSPIFMLDDHFDGTSAHNQDGDFQAYTGHHAVIEELCERQNHRPRGLLGASLTCFGIAALVLVAVLA
jgi:hypothetical protein